MTREILDWNNYRQVTIIRYSFIRYSGVMQYVYITNDLNFLGRNKFEYINKGKKFKFRSSASLLKSEKSSRKSHAKMS